MHRKAGPKSRENVGLKASIFSALKDMEEERKLEDSQCLKKQAGLRVKQLKTEETKREDSSSLEGASLNSRRLAASALEESLLCKNEEPSSEVGTITSEEIWASYEIKNGMATKINRSFASKRAEDISAEFKKEPSLKIKGGISTKIMEETWKAKDEASKKLQEELPSKKVLQERKLSKDKEKPKKEIPISLKLRKDLDREGPSKLESTSEAPRVDVITSEDKKVVNKEAKKPIEVREIPDDLNEEIAGSLNRESQSIVRETLVSENDKKKQSNLLQKRKERKGLKYKTIELSFINACAQGDFSSVRRFLRKKPDLVYYKTFLNLRYTGLHYAAKGGHIDIARYLLRKGAKLNLQTAAGYTPLHLAAICNHTKMAEIFVNEYNANVKLEDKSGNTYDCYLTDTEGHEKLTENGSPISLQSNQTQFSRMSSIRKAFTLLRPLSTRGGVA